MPFKAMKLRVYLQWIRQYQFRNIIVTHPGKEVPDISIKKTKQALIDEGLD